MCSILGIALGSKIFKDNKKNKKEIAQINSNTEIRRKELEQQLAESEKPIQNQTENQSLISSPSTPVKTTGTGINNTQTNSEQPRIGLNL